MNKDWKDNLRESLGDYQVKEPDGLWEGVEAGLVHVTGSKVRPLFWISAVAAAAVLSAFLFTGRTASAPSEDFVAVTTDMESVLPDDPTLFSDDLTISPDELTASVGPSVRTKPASKPEMKPVMIYDETVTEEYMTDVVDAEVEPRSDGNSVRTYWDGVSGTMDVDRKTHRKGRRFSLLASVAGSEGDKDNFSNYGFFQRSNAATQYSQNLNMFTESAALLDDGVSVNNLSSVLVGNLDRSVTTQVRHLQPVRISLVAEYRINERIGISSGLSYSRLVSYITSGSDVNSYETRQKIDYLGIPLSLNLHMVETNRFGLYAKAGVMGEKALSCSSATDYHYDGFSSEGTPVTFSEKQLQWSVDAALGVNFRLMEHVGLFAEPGLGYWFDNGSGIDNIYKERPLNFNLTLGIRTDFGR